VLRRLQVQTAGESHGQGMLATMTGFPAGVSIDLAAADRLLALRQGGRGRSSRQALERDRLAVLAGIHKGRTTGAPLVLAVWNRDRSLDERPALHRPRPGHADLAGAQKYGWTDMRPVLERASARETAARVAAGALASQLLEQLQVEVLGHVVALGGLEAGRPPARTSLSSLRRLRDRSAFHQLDARLERPLRRLVDSVQVAGDTLGGVVQVEARGVPPGLGGLDGFGTRLDARLAAAILSIPALKAFELGDALQAATLRGSQVHDAVRRPGRDGPRRGSNRAGGVEGGMSNGQPIVLRGWMKPLPTLRTPLQSWDFVAGKAEPAFFERADVTAVPAAAVVAEAMVALVLLDALLEKTGGDALAEVQASLRSHRARVRRLFGRGRRKR